MEIDFSKFETQMKKGLLEFVILSIISKGDSYSSDILEILKQNNLLVVEGTLYPLLSRLKNEGYISYYWMESKSGPPRKYFKITKEGQGVLENLKKIRSSISDSVNGIVDFK